MRVLGFLDLMATAHRTLGRKCGTRRVPANCRAFRWFTAPNHHPHGPIALHHSRSRYHRPTCKDHFDGLRTPNSLFVKHNQLTRMGRFPTFFAENLAHLFSGTANIWRAPVITTNSVPEICELGILIDQPEEKEGDLRCVAEFRLFRGDLLIGDEECQISISKAMISVELTGLSPAPGTRYGEPRKSNAVRITKSVRTQTSRARSYGAGGSLGVGGSLTVAKAAIGGEIHHSCEEGSAIEANDTFEHLRVRALPNLRWEVSEPDGNVLDGTYLEGDDLVILQKSDRANQVSFRAWVTVKQRDLVINQITLGTPSLSLFGRLSTTQRRLLDIFIAKSLSSALAWGGTYRGEIKLSEHLSEVEGGE